MSLNETGTYISFEKGNVRTLCTFSRNNSFIFDKCELLKRLPHSGFHNFILENKQIKDLLNSDRYLKVEDLNFAPEDCFRKVSKKCIRLLTLNESEMKEILFKQIFEVFEDMMPIIDENIIVGMKIVFDGNDSRLCFYCSNESIKYDISTLDKPIFSITERGYKYTELSDRELSEMVK